MIPVEEYTKARFGDRAHNAIRRALTIRPNVIPLGEKHGYEQVYRVERRDQLSRYLVTLFTDRDMQKFLHCFCLAGTPMIDADTQLPLYAPRPCFHAAAVLLYEGKPHENQLILPGMKAWYARVLRGRKLT